MITSLQGYVFGGLLIAAGIGFATITGRYLFREVRQAPPQQITVPVLWMVILVFGVGVTLVCILAAISSIDQA